ncbi:ABC transporter substrate-binding protein [Acrocarpospora pleiomorpha]|uniref:ABC transporter substrate-binding protein n=1 Tax=Acrocarpospora pleiomorpha TaxID=90975 RepID=A0A5M3X8M2_9ACTN|nr:sugar ABC transporter substrate-binding protein [Acrocarpospora pleiomorpha]GES17450.1 ABC transporter substrate-binding protein [Acrocarpospora pleiomorpha]
MAIRPRTAALFAVILVVTLGVVGVIVHNATRSSTSSSGTVTWWLPDWDWDVATTLVRRFESENPSLHVEMVKTTGGTVANKVSVALDAGNTPDLITESIARTKTYIDKGQLADLTSLYDNAMPASDFAPGLTDVLSVDGKTYAVPYRWATNALIYNTDLFAKAGISGPPTTWPEFINDAKKLTTSTVAGTAWPMQGDPSDLTLRFLDFALQGGTTIKNGTPRFTRDSVEQALELIGTSVVEGYASKSSFELDNTGIRDLFLQGRIAMYLGGVFDADRAVGQKFPVGTAIAPGPSGPGVQEGVGWAYIVPKAAKNLDGAKKLASFLGRPENMASLTLTFPARVSAARDAKFRTDVRKAYGEQLSEHSIPAPNDPRWTAMIPFVHDTIQEVALGSKNPQQGAAAIMTEADKNLGPAQ